MSQDALEQALLDEAIRLSMLESQPTPTPLPITNSIDENDDALHSAKKRRTKSIDDSASASTIATPPSFFAFGSGRYFWDNLIDAETSHPPNTSVSFAELIDADICRRALIAAMLVNPDWLFPHIQRVPHVCVVKDPQNHPPCDPRTGGVVQWNGVTWVSPVQPVLENNDYSLMHIKLCLFQLGDDRLRVVVCSSNGATYEWCAMGQSVWFQDFSRRRSPTEPETPKGAAFRATLYRVLEHWQHVPAEFGRAWLDEWSFDDTHGTLVLSAPGLWDEGTLLGMNSLREAVRQHNPPLDLELPIDDTNVLEYQPAHVGFLVSRWFNGQFLRAALAPPVGAAPSYRTAQVSVVYLTERSGLELAGPSKLDNLYGLAHNSIPPSFADNPQLFNRPDFADFRSIRRVPYHSKNCTRVWGDGRGWTYCGSHNLTAAAWGSYRGAKILIRNFELGVVLPYPCAHVYNHGSPNGRRMPWLRPPPRYSATDRPFRTACDPELSGNISIISDAWGS